MDGQIQKNTNPEYIVDSRGINIINFVILFYFRMTDKNQESKYAKLLNKEYTLSAISLPLSLTQAYSETLSHLFQNNSSKQSQNLINGFKTVSLKPISFSQNDSSSSTTSFNDLNMMFNSWKSKTEQFILLMEIRHNNLGFSWCDPALLSQNLDILRKLDFMKEERPIRPKCCRQRFMNILTNDEFDYGHAKSNTATTSSSSLISKPVNLKRNVNLKKKLKRSVSKIATIKNSLKNAKNNPTVHKQSRSNIQIPHTQNTRKNDITTKKQTISNTSNSSIQSNSAVSQQVNTSINDLIKFNEPTDDLIYNLANNINGSNSIVTNFSNPNELLSNHEGGTGGNNGNCTYYNLMPLTFTPVNSYYQQVDMSIPVMIESNAESSDFSELLNCLRSENEISIENDNMFIFNVKY
jgi:hypothetical protein